MGYANAQRSLDYIETLAEFVSRPEVAEVRLTLLDSNSKRYVSRADERVEDRRCTGRQDV